MLLAYPFHRVYHLYTYLGHIQISQIPERNEPSDDGKINFTSFFKMVKEVGYDGYVAGEYYASGEHKSYL